MMFNVDCRLRSAEYDSEIGIPGEASRRDQSEIGMGLTPRVSGDNI
jgi:hypothetical protein